MLDFQRGHMWFAEGDLSRAHRWFFAAQQRVPDYATAQGHLAEVLAARGDVEAAITRLRVLAGVSDDPDFAAQLARVLAEVGRTDEARPWRARAARRYDALLRDHLEAFADHAAEFWLDVDPDPERALRFATINAGVRRTTRALELLDRATRACPPG
jgi:hypothetical protein